VLSPLIFHTAVIMRFRCSKRRALLLLRQQVVEVEKIVADDFMSA
jgi:hypothetical protein